MKLETLLSEYRFSKKAKKSILNTGITSLYPPQAKAVEKGALDGRSLLMSVPTAAGKTLIAELCMLRAVLQNKGRCLYIAPLKALVNEKYEDFKEKYSDLGIKVGQASGDSETSDLALSRNQILIATAEKVDSLLRARTKWLINSLSVVVLDEIHFINDGARGPTLEILSARIKQLNPQAQILALSATVSNAEDIAKWLRSNLVVSDWRPIPLKEGVYFNQIIKFQDEADREIIEEPSDDLGKLTIDTLRGKGQVLVFVNSRRSSQAASRTLCKTVSSVLTADEKKALTLLSKQIIGSSSDATKICRKLGEVVQHGVAFHHAGLKPKQRSLIETNFKNNLIKVICSTPTLAAGVNLPARRTIIRDHKRFEGGLGSAFIPTSEYKQCAGRAGRPQYDKFGEAVLIAKSSSESKVLFDRYINADPEPVVSKLGNEGALRFHILASIAGDYVHDIKSTFDFISHTFLAHQKKTSNLIEMIGEIFEFLEEEGFIEKSGFRYHATPFGQLTSRLYLDPESSLIIRNGLELINAGQAFSNIGLLHLISCTPDNPLLKFGKNEVEEIEFFHSTCQDELIMNKDTLPDLKDFMLHVSIMKTTMMLSRWIEEEREEKICDQFNIGPGDIYRHTESARWLLYAAVAFADLFKYKNLTFPLANLKMRIQYGIKEELIDLIRLKGVGRIRARNLFKKKIKRAKDLKYLSIEELANVETIGKALAKDLLNQVNGKKADLESVKKFSQRMMDRIK